jgi:hypothetical protein
MLGNTFPSTWQVTCPQPLVIWQIQVSKRASVGEWIDTFFFQGSKDGSTWVSLAYSTGQMSTIGSVPSVLTVTVNDPTYTAYSYFRMYNTAGSGPNPGIAIFQMYGYTQANTTATGAYYLNTPLAVGGQKGGGQVCTQPPYQFLQRGGGKRLRKNMRHMKGSRHMKGGNGNFWNFAKFWNPDNPGQGGNVLSLSPRGISPSGIGSPVSTAGNPPIPPIQPWPAEKLIWPHDYTKGGFQSGGGKRTRKGKGKGKGRGLKGGGIIDDLQTFGRDIVYRMGSAVNGLSGFDNKIYNVNPSPTFQFPRGLGSVASGASSYNSLNLKNIYDKSYSDASLK